MLKTTVYLDEEILLILRGLADAEQRSQADIIREALQRYLQQIQAPNSNLPSGIERYHSGRSDVSQRAKELFQQAIQREHNSADRG
jgi:predicted transcriptional regulator